MRVTRSNIVAIFLLGAIVGVIAVQGSRLIGPTPDIALPVGAAPTITDYEHAIIGAVKKVGPSVVSVRTSERVSTFFGDNIQQGLGTGVIVSADGYILTNNHVIAGAERIIVKLEDGRQFSARSLGGDPRVDLAVLKIDANNLKPAVTADSDRLVVGQLIIAMGNPLGFERTVTTGIVSALKRTLGETPQTELENLIQTDATINPGNSGGPMINTAGQVVGINTAVVGNAPGGGLGFAVPINYARRVLADVKQYGRVRRPPRLGIQYYNVPPHLVEQGLPPGVLVDVYPGGPAQRGGLQTYDIITRVENQPVRQPEDLARVLRTKNAGDRLRITAYRPDDGKNVNVQVTLEEGRG